MLCYLCRELWDARNAWDSATSYRLKQIHPLRCSEQGLPFPLVPVQHHTPWGPGLGVAVFVPQFPLLYHEDNKFLTILVRSYEVAKCFSIASIVLISKFSGVRCRSVLLARHWVRWVRYSFFLQSGEEPQ